MSKDKTIKDLTIKELLEDLVFYTNQTQMKCPKFTDDNFTILWKYIKELQIRDEVNGKSK